MKITKNCLNCNSEFETISNETNRGNGKFCSLKCSGVYTGKQRTKPKEPNKECAWCGKKFYSRFKNRSKSGLSFCSNDHKNQASKLDGGIKEIFPTHYGTAPKYRDLAFTHYEMKCNRCGYDKCKSVLQVHHIDHNRENNDISNLEILCANCHMEHHFT